MSASKCFGCVVAALLVGLWTAQGMAQHDPNATNTLGGSYMPVNGKGGQTLSGPYEVVRDWPKKLPGHEKWHTGRGAAITAESPDKVIVAVTGEIPADYQGERRWGPTTIPTLFPVTAELTEKKGRWEHNIMILDREGTLLDSWEQWNSVIRTVQRLVINPYDKERHIWMSSGGLLKFTNDGKKLVMSSQKGCDPSKMACTTAQGSHLDFLPNGDFFIATNTSIAKYSADGSKKLMEFGKAGSGPGEFNGMHGVVIDAQRNRLYVSDRGNSRIQIFDLNGKHLDTWPNIVAPYCIRLTRDGRFLWVSDGFTQTFTKYDAMSGKQLTSWGTFGVVPGMFWGPHDFDTDNEGNLYVAEDYNSRVQKFRPRPDANPNDLIGDLMRGGR